MEMVMNMASQRPLVIFSRSSCSMCDTITILFRNFGADPAIHQLDQMPRGREIEQALLTLGYNAVPVVFIGGTLVGGANEVTSLHLERSLVPKLREAGAIWLDV
ncbi:monothiol glutaredoxin-S2-like [Cornus florida]|uniref:monothiol glutaredoxin-S2-like n=1 Tax=Cornus florida TaxID=4283 RepID=UPI0028A1B41E|nr:monothiol glutaredoxin-S2-like [Cornus florida]